MIICSHCSTVNHPNNVVCSHCGAPLLPEPAHDGDPYVGQVLGGRFLLEAIVGSGDIGMVYRGSDQRTGQTVAVKIVHPDVAATHGDELLQTARELARLRHAKVATVLGAARSSDGTTFIVSEFIQGQTLKNLLDTAGPLGAHRTADILFQICSALAPIHRAGRPHCNLKPENVFLVERDDGSDFVKIVDAGSPSLFGVKETAGGEIIIGTPKYFSPEQALGRPIGQASDQFTVGIIGYQLLTGALPFFGATPDQLLSAIANGIPTPVSQRTGGAPLPAQLEGAINRCLEKDPNRRYPDLRSIATELAAVIKSAQPAAPAPRKPFGAGRNLNTVIAGPDLMAQLATDDDDDEATALRQLPVDIEALLRSSAPAPAMASEPVPAPPRAPTPDPGIPAPLMFTGALSQAELQAQLSQERRGPLRADHDLSAALAAAAAEAEGRRLPPPSQLPQAPPPPDDGFDPFGDMELPPDPLPAAPRGRPSGNPVPSPELSNAIFDAISEELQTAAPPAPPQVAAAPLATAADFAALSPEHIRRAQDVASQVAAEAPRSSRGPVLGLVALLVLGLGAGAVYWFVLREPAPTPTAGRRGAPPAVPRLRAAVKLRLTSTPPGATVKEGERTLGITPLDVDLVEARPYTWSLSLPGHGPTTQTFDPRSAPEGEPATLTVALSPAAPEAALASAAAGSPASAAPSAADPGKAPAGKPPAGKAPASKPPASKPPAGQPPAGQPPASKTPAGEAARPRPTPRAPAAKRPTKAPPATQAPARKPPIKKADPTKLKDPFE